MYYDILITDLARNAGGTKEVARQYAATIVKWVVRQVAEEGCLVVNDFGKFLVEKHMEYVYLDIATKKRWLVPPRLSIKFIPAPLLEEEERDKGKVIPVIAEVIERQHQEKQLAARKYAVMFFKTILDAMEEGAPVVVDGLGTFLLTKMKVDDAIYGKVSYTPDGSMLADINRPFSYFQPVEVNEGVEFEDVETTTHRSQDDKGEQVFLIFKEEAPTPQDETDGSDGVDGSNGPDGLDGTDGLDGSDGPDVLDGASRRFSASGGSAATTPAEPSEATSLSDDPEGSSPFARWWKYAVASLVLLACVAAFFLMRGKGEMENPSEKDSGAVVENRNVDGQPSVPADKSDAPAGETSGEAGQAVGSEGAAPSSAEAPQLDFAKLNAQLPYCGYDIVGVASTITVTPGLTLKDISRRYLGTDYTEYLVVLNNGNDNPQPGQKYMIPKLQLRKNK
ncbi:MAG: HU family DNA-binding protein [Prevotella sp.]|nr:HU family DNA-binding protein [Prevotella sp.]